MFVLPKKNMRKKEIKILLLINLLNLFLLQILFTEKCITIILTPLIFAKRFNANNNIVRSCSTSDFDLLFRNVSASLIFMHSGHFQNGSFMDFGSYFDRKQSI